ncbi:MAG: ribosomal protein S18-alanine N-acetyltransferase [Desulfonatronovibrio sp.]
MKIFSYQVLPIEDKNLPELVSLERQCFAQPWSVDQYRRFTGLDHFKILGVFEHGELRSYISFYFMPEEAEIINLGVHPECRKRGMATSLVRSAVELCRKAELKSIFLEVRPSNVAALNLYQRFGFKEMAIRKNYYPDNMEDALVLQLDLTFSVKAAS